MLSREKKPGSRTAVRAVCSSSRTGEDWSFADPLHPPRGATLDLVPGLAAGDHTRPVPCLVFLSASPSGRCSSVSLQTATGCCKNLTPTVVLAGETLGGIIPLSLGFAFAACLKAGGNLLTIFSVFALLLFLTTLLIRRILRKLQHPKEAFAAGAAVSTQKLTGDSMLPESALNDSVR